ncbi:MAG: hypothetical protein QMD01_03590 [Thermodesulfovibrionales bacterium]|nr:hypothetical protein [Thermodesulfovibrionales bacterium]
MNPGLNELKRHIFFELMNLVGRVFVLVRYSDNVILGNRGFAQEEKDNGIILVFNSKMNFLWDDYGITATLVFGTSPQKCFVPADEIMAVYCPELNAQFVTAPQTAVSGQKETEGAMPKKEGESAKTKKSQNVIEVDFTKRKK